MKDRNTIHKIYSGSAQLLPTSTLSQSQLRSSTNTKLQATSISTSMSRRGQSRGTKMTNEDSLTTCIDLMQEMVMRTEANESTIDTSILSNETPVSLLERSIKRWRI
ncbi:hypothetical protein PIB30_018178 [Stylosanthes scabra]|uniref:Uncharacterized protein n=1 Tax=Stylosanthes scabra TaxID=79078 RepID=A0ABU6S7B9_9FABA|nr:hypothetical protein [Stylosanthes scabra]